jgi:diguanylate cyclase (GGDEF)-like protein
MDEERVPVAELVAQLGIPLDKIVFEITEESAVSDYDLFARAVAFYRDQGFQIAIDDFGVGYGGLKMLAVIEPDFVKIDRHFIHNIERVVVRRNLVDSIATACHRLGIKVIAEGIENDADAAVLLDMGVEFLQGFGLARPDSDWPHPKTSISLPQPARRAFEFDDKTFIGDIVHESVTLPPDAPMSQARAIFMDDPGLVSLPIVDGELCVGMLHRKTFFEKQLSGPFGFGTALSTYKSVLELSGSDPFVMVEARETLEDVVKMLRGRQMNARYDDICVSSNGKYRGTVAMSALLDAVTERSLSLARGSNPLSGLPGNDVIRREIEKRIAKLMHFDVCYIDIDNFKPFNDTYGFNSGDMALRKLSTDICEVLREMSHTDGFAGHIGGDDFLLITRPTHSEEMCRRIVARFESALRTLHGAQDYEAGFYQAPNRNGELETYPLMSLSIGIVSTEVQFFDSVAELSSVASEVKKAAKKRPGSSIVRDRRMMEAVAL